MLQFGEIIRRKSAEGKKYDGLNDIVCNLISFSIALRTSSLRKDALKFLALITL